MKRVPTQIAVGAERQRGGEAAAVEDAPGGHDRHAVADRVDDLGDEREGGDLPGVPACLGALRHHQVAAGLDGAHGVLDLAAHADDDHAVAVAQVDDLGRDAEPRHEGGRTALDDRSSTCSVMPPGIAVRRSTPKGLSVAVAHGGDLGRHLLVAHGGRAEAAEAAGVRDGGRQFGIGDTAHSGQHDGVLDAEQLGEAGSHECWPSLLLDPARCRSRPPPRGP